jgi:hypothetical protein
VRQRWRSLPVRAVLGALWRGRRANDSGGMSPRFACAAGLAGLAIFAAGCDSDESLDLRPYTIDTRRDGEPTGARVAHETPDGWVAATETTPGVFTFTPTGEDVVYAVICPPDADNEIVSTSLVYGTLTEPHDNRVFAQSCYRYVPEAVERQRIQFSVNPADATLAVAGSGNVGGGLGERTLRVRPGASDVVAMTADRALVRRAATFDPATPFVVDVAADGVDREPFAVALPTGDAGEVVAASYRFRTAGGATGRDDTPRADLRVIPASQVQSGDAHVVDVAAERGGSRRWYVTSAPAPAQLDLSLGFAPTFAEVDARWDDQLAMRWVGRPAGAPDWMSASVFQSAVMGVAWDAQFDATWLERHGQDIDGSWTPPDLSSVTGWSPAWSLDRARRSSTSWTLGLFYDGGIVDGIAIGRGSDWFGDFVEDPSLRARVPARRTASRTGR